MFDKLIERFSPDKSRSSKQNVLASNARQFAPNTKISYKPALIKTLQQENRALLSLYWKILTAAQNGKTEITRELLGKFKDLFVDHLLKENTSLYLYLRHSATQPGSEQAVKSIKAEVDELGRNVMRFLDEANEPGMSFDIKFIEQFKLLGESLMLRIEKEEAFVYPNYRPASA